MPKPTRLRLLITGGSSYLGQHLVPLAAAAYEAANHDVVYTCFSHDPLQLPHREWLDVRDSTAVNQLVQSYRPQVIIHTAGSNRGDDMEAVIRLGTQHITTAATAVNARLIHLSTDSIFRGDAAPYDETAVPDPVNGYGRAKADAETIAQAHPNAVIIRTSLIYSLTIMDQSTVWTLKALRTGQPVTLFDNQIRNPVWAETLSQACLELVQNNFTGILNVAGRQAMTRAEFGLKLLQQWGISETECASLTIGPSTSGEWSLNCELDLRRATAVLNTPLYGVDEVLQFSTK